MAEQSVAGNANSKPVLTWDECIGSVGGDTYVGLVFSSAWSVRIYEDHHDQTELTSDEVDKLNELLDKAQKRLEHVRENWDELESEYRSAEPGGEQ